MINELDCQFPAACNLAAFYHQELNTAKIEVPAKI